MGANWSLWADIPHTELWRAVALSLDIEPSRLPGYDLSSVRDPIFTFPFYRCPDEFKRRLEIAMKHLGQKLPIWSPRDPLWNSEVTFQDMARWSKSLNSPWLLPKEFPRSEETLDERQDIQNQEAASAERQLLKRGVFIDQMRPRWPTVEHDMKEASRNGLNGAKSDRMWDVEKATQWAISHGKFKSPPDIYVGKSPSTLWPR